MKLTCFLLLLLAVISCGAEDNSCDGLGLLYPPVEEEVLTKGTLRKVDQERGQNTESCLNRDNTTSPPPCRTLQYALHELEDTSVGGRASGLRLELAPGVYRSVNESSKIINSDNVAVIGAGVSKTFFVCGANGSEEVVCTYRNFQVVNSSNVYISGITFTGCGPITSTFYIGMSDYVFIKNCSFEDNISPPLLVYNTPVVQVSSTLFLNNIPQQLNLSITRNSCFFPQAENVSSFIDNRTISGGISLYMDIDQASMQLLVQDCVFVNNAARNDTAVALIRKSDRNGHGGAINLRLLDSVNSTICIRNATFVNNSAEAQAGALAISLGGRASRNKIIVSESRFEENRCTIRKCTGGAVSIGFFSETRYNALSFLDSNFTGNQAQSSGAVVLFTSVSAELSEDGLSDSLTLRNCWFVRNGAFFEGTALGAFSISHTNLIGIPVDIYDCHFHNNTANGGSGDTTAVTVYRVLLSFHGNNTFISNEGGGTSLLSSRMDVRGQVTFDRNSAVFGAGVAMSGRSLILLHEGAVIHFTNNFATELGAGLYVETTSSDFILSVLNTGCFIRYNSSLVDVPPSKWNATITFRNNRAVTAGAAIYANDMSRCRWLGPDLPGDYTIFQISPSDGSPFLFEGNTLMRNVSTSRGNISNEALATNPSEISATSQFPDVSYGEELPFFLSSGDQFDNFREAVWSLNAPGEQEERLGSLSSNNTVFSYQVPESSDEDFGAEVNETSNDFEVTFTLLQGVAATSSVLSLTPCHPGYQLNEDTNTCTCVSNKRGVVRCDANNRYFYTRDGFWVGVHNDSTPFFANTVPGFLNCTRLGSLPGCLFKYDSPAEQCAPGRNGTLCGDCQPGYGVSFDLRFCLRNCGAGGILLFVSLCVLTPLLSLAMLYFDFPLPNEFKGVIFYAQVIGVIYRSTPYLFDDGVTTTSSSFSSFFDVLINFLGFAMPFPVCLHERLPVEVVALLGYFPPVLALTTAVIYGVCANRIKKLSHRENYGFHGFYFLFLFVYKYIVDTSFIFVSCTNVDGNLVFLYQGTKRCLEFPFVLLLVFGSVMVILFGIVLPLYILKVIYAPQKMIQVRNTLSHGLKNGRKYLWYGVWDIWRRLLFVAVNLLISVTTRSVVLFMHCMLVLLCLTVLCVVKPYKKYHINVMEGLIILSLFSTTLAIYDRDNDLYVGSTVATVSIFFPFAYGVVFILYRITRILHRKFWPMAEKKWHIWERCKETWVGKAAERLRGKTMGFIAETEGDKTTSDPQDDVWRLEVINPLREKERNSRDSSFMEQSYIPELRETLLDPDS